MAHAEIMRERFAQLLDNHAAAAGRSRQMENAPLGVIDREPRHRGIRKVAVGTVKKSIAANASRWLRRN